MKFALTRFMSYSIPVLLYSAPLSAGTVGGGGPPAISTLEIELQQEGTAGLFKDASGRIGLGVRGDLSEEVRLSSSGIAGFRIHKTDLRTMSDLSIKSIDAVSLGSTASVTRSYRVADGDATVELILKDRRQAARQAAAQ